MSKPKYRKNDKVISFEEQRALDHEKYLKQKADREANQYKVNRREYMPPSGDQFDAIWKHLLYCRDTLNQPLYPETHLMLEHILSVKEKYQPQE